jgi:DnaJ like chaperone protein
MWLGKTVGGILGFAAAGPIGSLLGVFLGHQFDQSYGRHAGGFGSAAPQRIEQLFFSTTFAVMGHIAKVDGRVSEEEIDVARRIMHGMQLTPQQVRAAIEHFTRGKSPQYPLANALADLSQAIGRRRDLARSFLEIQTQAILGAGPLGQEKRELLWRVAQALGVGRVDLAQIEALVRARGEQGPGGQPRSGVTLQEAYSVLGIEPAASDKEVKTAYRRLMNQHHPDKLMARGLPKSLTAAAQEKTQAISSAYERIKTERGLK